MKYVNFMIKTFCTILCAAALILLCSCSSPQPEKAEYSTALSVSSSFVGERTFSVTYPKSVVSPDSDTAETLERIIKTNCPPSLIYEKSVSSGNIKYTFTLSFSSLSDYNTQLTELLGSRPVITFANPKTVLTKGWRIQESFQSAQLLEWLTNAAHNENIHTFDIPFEETSTTVAFGSENASTTPVISVNNLTGSPIASIKINTVNKGETYDRTFVFRISQTTFDSLGDKISSYFRSVTDTSASSDWQIEEGMYSYTVRFIDITLKQLEGYTNRLLSSVYGDVEYIDKTVGNDPLSFQNSYTETLDFSNYVSDNNTDVTVEYVYSVVGGSELDNCRIYRDFQWITAESVTAENNPGKIVAVSEKTPTLTLRINDGKQYVPKLINITLTPLDNELLQKSYSFIYPISSGGYEASNYTASYFREHGLNPEESSENDTASCTISFTGTAGELNMKITDIFGDNNLISFSSEVPFMTLRTLKNIEDTVDLSALLTGKNVDTPVTYTLVSRDGEKSENLILTYESSDEENYAETNDDGNLYILLGSSKATLKSAVSVPNVTDIIVFFTISIIIILAAVAVIFFLRNQKLPIVSKGKENSKMDSKENEHPRMNSKSRMDSNDRERSRTDSKEKEHTHTDSKRKEHKRMDSESSSSKSGKKSSSKGSGKK